MLNYACQAIPIGRPWLQSTYALQWAMGDHILKRKVLDLVAKDLNMFRTFLMSTEGFVTTVPFLDRLGVHKGTLEIMADASGNSKIGFVCYCPSTQEWFRGSWTDTNWFKPVKEGGLGYEANTMIFELELFAITLAFKVFRPRLSGRFIILRLDSDAVCKAICHMTSHLEYAMELLRDLTITCMSLQILVSPLHIRGQDNIESNKISRLETSKIDAFLQEHPSFHKHNIAITSGLQGTLQVTEVFKINRINDNQKIAIELFADVCKNQGLPLELTDKQATAYLLFLSQMNYSATSVRYRWNPIFKMCEVKISL